MKYIIEFEDTPSFAEDGIAYYQCRQVPWWFVGDSIIGRLTSAQDILSEIDEAYKRGLEEGKAVNDKRCEGCKYEDDSKFEAPCVLCSSNFENRWTAKQTDDNLDIIRNGIHNWVTELNIGLEDISKILEDMRHD